VSLIYFHEFAASAAVKIAKFMTRATGDLETVYDSIARLGLLWVVLMRVVLVLKIDRIILVPARSKLVPIPLFMSTSEVHVRNVFKPKAGDIVVDVGTYIGRYTLLGSKYVGNTGMVIGIEADFSNYQKTQRNVRINNAKNVVLIWSAASNHDGKARLYQAEKSGRHSLIDARSRYQDVPCNTVDNLLNELGVSKVDWLKIDVEGAEMMVLEGSNKTLAMNEKLKLLIEIHPAADSDAIFRLLEQLHYKVQFLEPRGNATFHILASKE
jgi:FkbM family methyltransferase